MPYVVKKELPEIPFLIKLNVIMVSLLAGLLINTRVGLEIRSLCEQMKIVHLQALCQ